MAPLPQDNVADVGKEASGHGPIHHEDVVISGMAAAMPGCNNMMDFIEKLYGKENLAKCEESRWKFSHPELPPHTGKIRDLDRFDAQFFMVNSRLAHFTDVLSRKLLELSYEALFDAGVSAGELNGRRVGVFVAVSYCESEKICSYQEGNQGIAGCNRAMFANRISYWLNSNGPSISLDCNGCGSIVALEQAHQAILSGRCESAIVGACRLLLHPQSLIHYGRQVPLNETGVTKSYDQNADGETLSEGIAVVFLQKQKDARRIYATIAHVKTGYNAQITSKDLEYTPNQEPDSFKLFLEDFYKEAGVSPSEVEYVEGFGSGLPRSDKDELEVIDKIFTKDRKTPLQVGTVMSNIGYTEAASGLSSVIKLLLAYQQGKIAGNINCFEPRSDVAGIREGRLSIVTDHLQFNRSYTAINTFSIIGAYGHVLLKGNHVHKDLTSYTGIPYLLTISGRHESAVEKILNWVKSRPINVEEISLLNTMHKVVYSKHLSRGYGVFKTINNETKLMHQEVDYCDVMKRSLWFVYSGMGSQWVGMGKQLMRIPIFADAIKRCDEVLAPKGMDIVNIITSHDRTMFDNILHSFIGIAAIQIGITDILKAVGIVPDFIIGHSVGELGCAYADGCVTTEEMILLAYYRGLVSIQTPLIKGSMAAIGLGYKQIIKLLPPEIAVACHNGPDSCTISGPADIMEEFVNELSSKEIFAKEVACSNIAYHSKYIATAGPKLLEYCRKVIKSPKLRSDRWLSTSVPQERWDEPSAKYSSAEYHVNNLLNPVLFEETCHNIPNNAVLIEVAPHGLLQAILKRSLPQDCDYIPLTRKSHMDNAEFLLGAIGKIYLKGYDVDISALYPKIDYPVSTKTSSLSHLVEWDHSEKWTVCYYLKPKRLVTACYKPIITIYDEEYQYLDGYRIQGKRILPYSVALLHVWDTLAMIGNKHRDEMSVQFQDVRFYSQPALLDQNSVHLTVELHRGSGRFEVYYDHGIIIRGHIISEVNNIPNYKFDDESESMYNSGEVYKILQEKGYDFKNAFCPIHKINKFLTQAELSWNNNWVTLIEGMIQMKILAEPHDGLSKLEHVHRLSIDVKVHFDDDKQNLKTGFVESRFYKLQNTIQCGGVTIENISFTNVPKQKLQKSVIKTYRFNPFFQSNNNDERTNLYVLMQIVAENTGKETLTVYTCGSTNSSSIDKIIDLLKSPPEIYIKLINIDVNAAKFKKTERPDVIIVDKNQSQKSILERFYTFLPAGTFIITSGFNIEGTYPMSLYKPVVSMGSGVNKLELAIWKPSLPTSTSAVTVKTSSDFNFLRKSHKDLRPQHKLLIFTTYPPIPGLKELVKELRRGPGCQNVCTVLIDQNELNECVDNNTGFELAFNVLTKGTWGGEYYMPNIETELISSRYVRLQILQPGDFNSLSWVKAPQESGSGIAVTVHFAGLNVYDAKKVMSEVATSDDDTFGMDFSGVTERGTRVMGMVSSGAVASVVRVDPQLLWPVPEYWSLEDAATVPLPYCLAFYCLGYIVTLHRGMRVLVHGGAGGLGQAVISIALAHECTVFTTVSDLQKKRFLRKLFPDLPADHIGNSRNDSFSDMVLQKTKGEGCDIIISCVKGDLKNATLKCCAASGTTIDTVQIHTREDFQYGMYNMMKCRNYVAIDFISIFKNQNRDLIKKLHGMVCGGIAAGYVRPLSRVSVAASAARSALGLLAAAKHRGRVLLKMRTLEPAAVVPRLYCSSDKFQLVICNNDDLGIQLADKLVKQGAKKLLLHFIKSSTFLDHKKRIWNHNGVHVETLVQKINDKKSMLNFFKDTSRFGLVEGIYIVATKDLHSLVADADAAAREIFTFLRYFAVVSRNEFVGYDVHLQRTSSNLPSTLIELHNLEEFDDDGSENSNRLNRQTALEGIEAALCKNRSAFIVYGDRIPEGSIVDEIAKVTGLDSVYEADDDTILEVLGVDEDRAALLHKQIERKFGIYLVKELIPKMKISEFEQLQVKVKDLSVDDLGLDGYFNYIDTDEIRASCDLMPLPTLAQPAKLRPEEFDMTATYLCIVPGIEGSYKRFRQLSERLKLPALVLQLGREPGDVDVDHIANRLTEVLRKKLKLKENFYLFGYEFGVPIALKVAALLESSGLTGTVYCLGGTPEDIRNTFISQLKHNNLKELQDTIIHHVSNRLTVDKDKMNYLKDVEDNDDNDDITNKSKTIQEYDKELDEKLKLLDNWEDKVDACLRLIKRKTTHTHQYAKVVLETVYARVRILMDAKTTPSPIKSKIIFLRPYSSKSTEDLSLYSKDFEKHNLDSTLANMTKDLRVTTLINKYLSKDILEKFDKSNHCETVVEEDDLFSLYNNDNMKQVTE